MRPFEATCAALVLTSSLFAAGPAVAQEASPTRAELDELRRQVDELRQRLDASGEGTPPAGAEEEVTGVEPQPEDAPGEDPAEVRSSVGREPQPVGAPPGERGPLTEEPSAALPGETLWTFFREHLRLSVTLNNFYLYRDNSPVSLAGPTDEASTFAVGQFELDLFTAFPFGVDMRVDLDFAENDAGIPGSGALSFPDSLVIEQAFVRADLAKLAGLPPFELTFGRFNAPIGFEPIDAPGLWQFSRSNVATFLTPQNLTGAMVAFRSEMVDVEAYVANGWDVNVDRDEEKTVGGRVTLKLFQLADGGSMITIAPSLIVGHEPNLQRSGDRRVVVDVVAVIRPIDRIKLALEYNYGHENNPIGGGRHEVWHGVLASLNVRILDWFAITLRGDYVQDEDGFRTGFAQHLRSYTAALLFKLPTGTELIEEFYLNVEGRWDKSNVEVFTDRSPSTVGDETHQFQFAFQVFFYF